MTSKINPTDFARIVRDEVESRRESIVEFCESVVTANSVNPPGDTTLVAERVRDFFDERGMSAELFHKVESMPSVVVRIDSGKPGKNLLFNAHLDTMPPGDLSEWTVEPFELTRRNGILYGLGMGNMKGAVVAMSHAMDILANNRDQWNGTITFTAVSDEVVFGPNGAQALIEDRQITGDALICGEGPGFRRLSHGEKGVLWVRIEVKADSGHSSSVRSTTSASARIARIVSVVDGFTGWRGDETFEAFRLRRESGLDEENDRSSFLTANVGVVQSGTFIGQVSTTAHSEIDFRIPPGLTTADVLAHLTTEIERIDADAHMSVIKGWEPNITDVESDIVEAWRAASLALEIDFPELAIRLPASDASRWRRLGVPALCYGPQPLLSSGSDDYAVEDEVLNCVMLYVVSAREFLT